MDYEAFKQQFGGFTGFFDVGDPDLIYQNTGSEIKAYAKPGVTKFDNISPYSGDISALPKFNLGFVTDYAKQQFGQGEFNLSSFGAPPVAPAQSPAPTAPQTPQVSGLGLTSPLQFGSQGDQVKQLQNFLISQGFKIDAGATGYFGEQTKNALSAFQKEKGITQDATELGFFGPKTMQFIGSQAIGGAPKSGVQAPAVSSIAGLYASQAIADLEKKIKAESEAFAAGVAKGGATEILQGLFDKFGIAQEMSMVKEYNKMILDQQALLKKIPEDIKKTLQDVGVSESQYNRLVLEETKKPLETLATLMQQKGAAQDSIDQALTFVKLFADVEMQDQAAKLKAMEFQLNSDKEFLKDLKQEQKDLINLSLKEKENILTIANTAIQNGAPKSVVDAILKSLTANQATSLLAESGYSSGKKFGTYTYGGDIYQYPMDAKGQITGPPVKIGGTGGGSVESPLNTAELNYINDQLASLEYGSKLPFGTTKSQADAIVAEAQAKKSAPQGPNWFQSIWNNIWGTSYGAPGSTQYKTVTDPASEPVGSTFYYNGTLVKKSGTNSYDLVTP